MIFVEPDRYTDASLYGRLGARPLGATLDGIRLHLLTLGAWHLRPGETLTVEVLDIDLAGEYRQWRPAAADVRVMDSAKWPRLKLRYVLFDGERIALQAEESLTDLGYLSRSRRVATDSLGYEKAMLDDWFRARILDRRPVPR